MVIDASGIRSKARLVRAMAADTRDQSLAVRRAGGVRWESVAASRCREQLADEAGRIDTCTADLEDAAHDLDLHAAALEQRIDELVAIIAHAREQLDVVDHAIVAGARDVIEQATASLGTLWRALT